MTIINNREQRKLEDVSLPQFDEEAVGEPEIEGARPGGRKRRLTLLSGIFWTCAAAALAATASWYGFRTRKTETDYLTSAVVRRTLTQAVTASGQLNPVVKVQVGSQASGIIQRLLVDYNSVVKKGQIIAQLDPSTYTAVVRQNEGELESAKASLELARNNARRYKELHSAGLISDAEYDTAASTLRQGAAAVQVRQAALARSKADLALCTIYAPIDGVVISRNVDVGQTVAASLSAPTLFQIANDLTRMQLEAKVSEADIAGIRPGQSVRFTVDAFPSKTFEGRVIQVRNEAVTSQNVITYDTVIEAKNPNLLLKPGMTAVASIIVAERQDVLAIPNAALSFRLSQPPPGPAPPRGTSMALDPSSAAQSIAVVFLKNEKSAQGAPAIVPRRIRTGLTDGASTEVIEGLSEGDEVVTGESAQARSSGSGKKTTNPFSGNSPGPAGGPPPPPPGAGGP